MQKAASLSPVPSRMEGRPLTWRGKIAAAAAGDWLQDLAPEA